MKHAEVLVAISEDKVVEYYSPDFRDWLPPNSLEAINPISFPEKEWRVQNPTPK